MAICQCVAVLTAKAKGLNYNRWLDQRLDWVGLAPAGATDGVFVEHHHHPFQMRAKKTYAQFSHALCLTECLMMRLAGL